MALSPHSKIKLQEKPHSMREATRRGVSFRKTSNTESLASGIEEVTMDEGEFQREEATQAK